MRFEIAKRPGVVKVNIEKKRLFRQFEKELCQKIFNKKECEDANLRSVDDRDFFRLKYDGDWGARLEIFHEFSEEKMREIREDSVTELLKTDFRNVQIIFFRNEIKKVNGKTITYTPGKLVRKYLSDLRHTKD